MPGGMTGAEFTALVAAARKGEPGAVARLRAVLDSEPGLWDQAGDLADAAERAWVGVIAGDDVVFAEALQRKAAAMRAELAGPGASPLLSLAGGAGGGELAAGAPGGGGVRAGGRVDAERGRVRGEAGRLGAAPAPRGTGGASVQKMLPASSAAPAPSRLGPDGRVVLGVVAGDASAVAGVRRAV